MILILDHMDFREEIHISSSSHEFFKTNDSIERHLSDSIGGLLLSSLQMTFTRSIRHHSRSRLHRRGQLSLCRQARSCVNREMFSSERVLFECEGRRHASIDVL